MQRRCPREDGFTLVEVLVAMSVLLVGLLGVVGLVDAGNRTTSSSLKREAGTALARDVLERAHQTTYASLIGVGVGNTLRLSLGDAGATTALTPSTFTVVRRGVAFTVTVTSCRMDEGSDGVGVHDVTYCDFADALAAGAAAPTAADLALGLKLAGVPLKAVAGGTVLDEVCALLGVDPLGRVPGFDAALGRGNRTLALVASGATLQLCPGGEQPALDLAPDDLTQVSATVAWTDDGHARAVRQATLIPNPAAGT